MNKFQIGLRKYIFLIVFAILHNCVSSSKYESLQKEKERNEEISYKRIYEDSQKIKLLSEELELLKEECQQASNGKNKKSNIEDEKIRRLLEFKRKNGN